jgi:hypothetical protein
MKRHCDQFFEGQGEYTNADEKGSKIVCESPGAMVYMAFGPRRGGIFFDHWNFLRKTHSPHRRVSREDAKARRTQTKTSIHHEDHEEWEGENGEDLRTTNSCPVEYS